MKNRIKNFKKILKDKGLDGFIVTNPVNIFYLTGFKGISPTERETILVFNPQANLIAPKLYQTEVKALSSPSLKITIVAERNELNLAYQELFKKCKTIGFEENNLTFAEFKNLKKILYGKKITAQNNLVENLRLIKEDQEISNILKAQTISQNAFEKLIKTIKPGQTEAEIADKLEKIMKTLGGQGLAFESIIASGPNSALPHYLTGKRKIKKGEFLLFDFGTKYKNYCADLSRTIFVGKALDHHKNVYKHVELAQKSAIEKISHQLKTSEVFHAANDIFKDKKLDNYFLHSLGHGIGLEVHESPYIRASGITDELLEGMVFSIEPGLYLNWGGVRIEDLVVIKNGRAKILGKKSEFIEI